MNKLIGGGGSQCKYIWTIVILIFFNFIALLMFIVSYSIIYNRYDEYNQKNKNNEEVYDNLGPGITFGLAVVILILTSILFLFIEANWREI